MQNVNPYAPPIAKLPQPAKTRLGIVPAAFTGCIGIFVVVIAVLHFAVNMTAEIGRAVSGGHLVHAFGCVFATLSLIACGVMLLFAARQWLEHRVVSALLLTFAWPPALVCLALYFFYWFGAGF